MSITIRPRYGGICSVGTLRNNLGPALQDLAGESDQLRTQYEQGPCSTPEAIVSLGSFAAVHAGFSRRHGGRRTAGRRQASRCWTCHGRRVMVTYCNRPARYVPTFGMAA